MYGVPMNKSAGVIRVHGWSTRGPWMMRKRNKKSIGKGELVGLIRGLRKTRVSKPRERQ
jgi:hypothetical protein